MKRLSLVALVALIAFAVAPVAYADPITPVTVNLYMDAAPNVYGSPNYAGWWANAQAAAAAGTFVNMGSGFNGANDNTTNYEIEDETVYSFGDLGSRLHFIYFVPNETVEDLTTRNFQIGLTYHWDGDNYDLYHDYYGSSWLTPTSWVNYNDGHGHTGVIGTAGFAWWGAYGVNTQPALDADMAAWRAIQEDVTFTVRIDGQGDTSLTGYREAVPDGGTTASLLGGALLGLGLLRRKFRG
jgi:hypothetical protein